MEVSVRPWTPQDNYERWDYLQASARYSILVPHSAITYARRGGPRSEHDRPVLILADGSNPVQVHLRQNALRQVGVDIPLLTRALEEVDLRSVERDEADAIARSRAVARLIGDAVDECLG